MLALFASSFSGHTELLLLTYGAIGVAGSYLIPAKSLWPYTKQAFLLATLFSLTVAVIFDWPTSDKQGRFGELLSLMFIINLPISLGALYIGLLIKRMLEK